MPQVSKTLQAVVTVLALLGPGVPSASAQPFAYIVNNSANKISVLDTATNAVVAQIVMSPNPIDVAVDPAGAFAYVVGGKFLYSVIDAATNTVVAHQKSPGGSPNSVALHPTKPLLYIAQPANKRLVVVDLASRAVRNVEAGKEPYDIAVHPAGTFIYVSNSIGNTVSVIDSVTNVVVATVNVPGPAYAIAMHPDGTRVYVSNWSSSVSVIDTATNTVIKNLPLIASSIAVHPAGSFVYLGDWESGNGMVTVLDATTKEVVARVSLGPTAAFPPDIAVHPAGTFAYALNFWENTVSVIDTATHTLSATVPAGSLPLAIALQP